MLQIVWRRIFKHLQKYCHELHVDIFTSIYTKCNLRNLQQSNIENSFRVNCVLSQTFPAVRADWWRRQNNQTKVSVIWWVRKIKQRSIKFLNIFTRFSWMLDINNARRLASCARRVTSGDIKRRCAVSGCRGADPGAPRSTIDERRA